MNSSINPISDKAFLAQFEDLTLDKIYFNHLGHLRLAWLYLQQENLETAINKVCVGIKAYAESLGAKDKFNLTITDAIVRIMAQRINTMPEKNWQLFLDTNRDLVNNTVSVLSQYFSLDQMMGEKARGKLIAPDLKDI